MFLNIAKYPFGRKINPRLGTTDLILKYFEFILLPSNEHWELYNE